MLDDLPRHGLGDIRSFEWSVDGDRIVVDLGVYECRNGLPVIALHEFGATVREGADGLHLQGLTEAKQAHELQLALVQAYQVLLFHASYHLKFQLPWVIDRFAGLLPGVPAFFFISGLLVTASLATRGDLWQYAKQRVRRIVPGLWLAVVASIILLAVFGRLDRDVLSNWRFPAWLASQFFFVEVFHPSFFRSFGVGVVNGSLWTIPVEMNFYVILPVLCVIASHASLPRQALSRLFLAGGIVSFAFAIAPIDRDVTLIKILDATPVGHFHLFTLGGLAFLHYAPLKAIVTGRFWPLFAAFIAMAFIC